MDRRTILGFALVALLAVAAGCSANGSLQMEPVDDAELAAEASHSVADQRPDHERDFVSQVIQSGSATVTDRHPPVDEELPFRYQGGFYDLSYTETGTEPGYDVGVEIDYNASSVDGEVVDYEKLPTVDRRALTELLRPIDEDALDRDAMRLEPGYDFGVGFTYTEDEAESSVLVSTQEYDAIRYEGETYPVRVDADSETLTVYRYESTVVAESAGEYARQLREDYAFELSGLSDAEREVVDGALNDTNYIEESDNEGFDSLVDRFRAHEAVVETEYDGHYVVRYDGKLHWVEMDYGSYVDDDGESEGQETPPAETPAG
jgi:hypothetical protein